MSAKAWYDRTAMGRTLSTILTITIPVCMIVLLFVVFALIGQITDYIIPSMSLNEFEDIFTSSASVSDWFGRIGNGTLTLVFLTVIILFTNLMLLPLHIWLKIQNKFGTISFVFMVMIPFYVCGLQFFGLAATKITNNPTMISLCNMSSFHSFMNTNCIIYGVYTEFVVLGIEIVLSIVIGFILCMTDKHSGPEIIDNKDQTKTDEIINLEDSQMATGAIKQKN